MSTVYSEYKTKMLKFIKSQGMVVKDKDDFGYYAKQLLQHNFKKSKETGDDGFLASAAADFLAEFAWKFEKCNHYFLDYGLYEFLISSVKYCSDDYFRTTAINKATEDHFAKGFFVHFPKAERDVSVFISPLYTQYELDDSVSRYMFMACDGNEIIKEGFNHSDFTAEVDTNETMRRFVFGFSLYLDAFPDVVREADGVKHVGHYKGHRHSVKANDIVRTEATHSVSPHFRRGHFRLLSSDKFKHKRGQTIFIKGMFIKGHAFDVLADDK